jgi:hypothetical protein
MVVLKTCNEVSFFISVKPFDLRPFKFAVSWLCDDHIAAEILRRKRSSTSRYNSHLSVLFLKIDIIPIASRYLVGDSRMGTAIGPRSR